MNINFRKAAADEIQTIWKILQDAIQRRKSEGSEQWQDGYPNPEIIEKDLARGAGFVLTEENKIVGYCSVAINDEPAYSAIEGCWLTKSDFVVVHRVAVSQSHLGKGFAKKILGFVEAFARNNTIQSIKADTNWDNAPMLKIFEDLGYIYCGEVFFRGSARKAFEKVLD